jgi:hypothetical protein
MGYEAALEKAWDELASLTAQRKFSVKFLTDEYGVDAEDKKVFSDSCNVPAKDYTSIILLHYLIKKLQLTMLPQPTGKWVDFRELGAGDAYYPTFKKRTIDVVLRKQNSTPGVLTGAIERFGAKEVQIGDVGVAIEPLEGIRILVTLWKPDEEFGPAANILFDENIRDIFCIEDIIVLTEIVVHAL